MSYLARLFPRAAVSTRRTYRFDAPMLLNKQQFGNAVKFFVLPLLSFFFALSIGCVNPLQAQTLTSKYHYSEFIDKRLTECEKILGKPAYVDGFGTGKADREGKKGKQQDQQYRYYKVTNLPGVKRIALVMTRGKSTKKLYHLVRDVEYHFADGTNQTYEKACAWAKVEPEAQKSSFDKNPTSYMTDSRGVQFITITNKKVDAMFYPLGTVNNREVILSMGSINKSPWYTNPDTWK